MGVLTEIPGQRRAHPPGRLGVAQPQVDLGAPATGRGPETDLTGVVDVGAVDRTPRNPLARYVVGNPGVPCDAPAERGGGPPVAGVPAGGPHLVEMGHEARQA